MHRLRQFLEFRHPGAVQPPRHRAGLAAGPRKQRTGPGASPCLRCRRAAKQDRARGGVSRRHHSQANARRQAGKDNRPGTSARIGNADIPAPRASAGRGTRHLQVETSGLGRQTIAGRGTRWGHGIAQAGARGHDDPHRSGRRNRPRRHHLGRRRVKQKGGSSVPSLDNCSGEKSLSRADHLGRLLETLALVRVEIELAQPDGLRRHFDQFVVLDPGQRPLQRHADRRRQLDRFVLAGGTDVGQLLALQHIHFEIVVAAMDADDHALIDLDARIDDHRAAVFQVPHGVSHRLALLVGDQHAVGAARQFALVGLIGMEQPVHHGGAARIGQQFRLVADQAARRRVEDDALAVAAGRAQLDHLGLALRHFLDDDAGMLLVDVDDDFLDRLQQFAIVALLHDDARPRHGDLEALAAHRLDQHGQLQFAAAGDEEGILVGRFLDLQRDIALGFAQQAVADDAAGHLVAFGAGQRAVVDQERHGHRRRIDRLRMQRLAHGRVAERVCDRAFRQAGDGDDIARLRFVDRLALEPAEGEDLRDTAGFDLGAVMVQHLDRLVGFQRAALDAAGDDAAEEGIGFQDGADHAERAGMHGRRRHMLDDEVEQRRQALVLRTFGVLRDPAVAARTVEDREVELLVGGVECGKQVEHFVDHLDMAGIRPVDLVDDDDRLQADLERLADDELGLRHRPLGGVDQHDGRIHHRQDALDLTAEIGVARRVDDVDAGVLPVDRGRLGQDGDAAFLFEVVGIHGALGDALVVSEGAGLLQKLVDEGGFSMVDVRDDRDITNFHVLVSGALQAAGQKAPPLSVARLIQGFSHLRKRRLVTKYLVTNS
ncbi:hypothetical protein MESS2_1340046 [Mesorhizobium metallidurans STM 2683]|uniref:Uncharacterized protein n=1 Tax=Mesorhizobium metallidurans STM 2683 TaxID=1297569 RepID=M5EKG8_9HYPH|nr:hypothetical protein MESS2_1340046 [Mesorhizobium metallidurans STM 2683]